MNHQDPDDSSVGQVLMKHEKQDLSTTPHDSLMYAGSDRLVRRIGNAKPQPLWRSRIHMHHLYDLYDA